MHVHVRAQVSVRVLGIISVVLTEQLNVHLLQRVGAAELEKGVGWEGGTERGTDRGRKVYSNV